LTPCAPRTCAPQVLTVERQDIEGVELDLLVVPARVQCAEVGDGIDTEHDSLAVNDELLMPVLKRRLDDPGIAIGPVVRASGNQAISVALQAEAVSFEPKA